MISATLMLALVAPAAPAGATPAEDEATFLTLINRDRTRAGLPALVLDTKLAATSRSWSVNMGSKDQMYHDPNLGAVATSVDPAWRSIGENVGVGYSATGLHDAFMNSAPHRANVMSPNYNRIGIGVAYAGGKTWVTVRFLQGPAISGPTGLEPTRTAAPPVPIQPTTNACPTVPVTPFVDISGNTHARGIACAYGWQLASGRDANYFAPNARVTRGQMASFLANLLDVAGVTLPANPADAFTDDEASMFELQINQLANLGVVRGKTATTYAPGDFVSREAMATFLVRAYDKAADSPLPTGVDRFWDDDDSAHEPNINKVGQAGLAAGVSSTRFAPGTPVTRGQMATFVSRTLDLLIEEGGVSPG